MARIGIDAHAIGERLTGNETYIVNLIENLVPITPQHEYVLFFTVPDAYESWKDKYANVVPILVSSQPFLRIPFILPWLCRRERIDLLHVQYAGPPIISVPLITTVHDISYEHYPEYFTKKEVMQFKATIPHTAKMAKIVLTVSEYSRQDLIRYYGLSPDRVVVTYDGVGPEFRLMTEQTKRGAIRKRYEIEGRYLIAVGNLQPRKNLVRLIKAYGRLRELHGDIGHKLVIVGKKAWKYDSILDFASGSPWSADIILTDYVPAEDLPYLYSMADALVYPSIFEGFGLPPLEAMACGTPVVVSDRSSLPEIVGDAGLQVDPFDEDAILQAMANLIFEPEKAKRLGEIGIKRARKFTWEQCARRTLQAYEEVLSAENNSK